ncbi:protein FAM209B-like [Cervus elaphus]|uniref:protein FAM209B-like n=1 Tax=Cervus elaphus TaxID=9860 RepID=UPI001CC2C6A4|nr:protein FAM209B-like [Cervus elaphus]
MFTSLGKKAKEIQGKMLCRGHFLIWQNRQEHAQDWLEITLLWLFFIVLRYVTVKLAGESGESKVQTPAALQARSFGSLGRQKEKTSSEEDYMFHTLTRLEMDLVKVCEI